MLEVSILAIDRTITLTCEDDQPYILAARYTTMAIAAATAKKIPISNVSRYASATFTRALNASPTDLRKQMDKWAAATRDRHELLAPVCTLLFAGARINATGETLSTLEVVPPDLRSAAATLFGHVALACGSGCQVCDTASEGDWSRALRLSAGSDQDQAAASLVDAYRAARRGGLIPSVAPHAQDGSNFVSVAADEKPVF